MLTVICLSHAENVASRATLGVADDNHSTTENAVADDPWLTVVFASIFYFDSHAFEHKNSVLEVKAAISQGSHPLL